MSKLVWTNENIINFIKNNSNYQIINMLDNNGLKTIITLKCSKGHEYTVDFAHFKRGQRCSHCASNKKYTYDEVKEYVESQGYVLLSDDYINCEEKLILKCPVGHEYYVSFTNFRTGNRCPLCCTCNKKYTYNEVKDYVESQGYTLLSDNYINCKTKLKLLCSNGHEYFVSFDNFKRGKRCSSCKKRSLGEEKILDVLNYYGIQYIRQKTFDNCYYKYKLPFDFYLPDYNIIIEYDGIQHFEEVEAWGGLSKLELTQLKDEIKNEYCMVNDIQLIRIPYWNYNDIEYILTRELNL